LSPTHLRPDTLVLGVDPGTLVTGYGVVSRRKGRMSLVTCGIIKNSPFDQLSMRLVRIYSGLRTVIETFHPDEFAIESAFYGKNAQSALKLGHARGVSLLAAAEKKLPISEYTPREIKKAVVGKGQASKSQVQYMVRTLLALSSTAMKLDASDAIATAICRLHRMTEPGKEYRDWKSFIAAHPERVRT